MLIYWKIDKTSPSLWQKEYTRFWGRRTIKMDTKPWKWDFFFLQSNLRLFRIGCSPGCEEEGIARDKKVGRSHIVKIFIGHHEELRLYPMSNGHALKYFRQRCDMIHVMNWRNNSDSNLGKCDWVYISTIHPNLNEGRHSLDKEEELFRG